MPSSAPAQLPIGDYGLLADGLTAALVGTDGGVGWLCLPRFDSPSVFAAILDGTRGGACLFAPESGGSGRQRYVPDTNVLVTDWTEAGVALQLTDWMPARFDGAQAAAFGDGALCRWADAVAGPAKLRLVCAPRLNYGEAAARWCDAGGGMWVAHAEPPLWAQAGFPLRVDDSGALVGDAVVHPGTSAWFVFGWGAKPERLTTERVRESLAATTAQWQAWAAQAQYDGPYRAAVVRSALALKALIYAPTGAIVAAPTTSLPEAIGGPRNWDYRYCWPRDATFALYGLSLLGYHDEAGRFLEFIARVCDSHPPPLQVCYRVDGSLEVPERELPHLAGYRQSRPVRIGNAAALQRQLDCYGEVMDALYTYAKWRRGVEAGLWRALRPLADYAAAHWPEPDESIWEVRGGRQQFVYSKVLCWVALDRAVKLAERYGLPGAAPVWRRERDAIHQAVMQRGYNSEPRSFTQTFDNQVLDSSLLLLPLLRFLSPYDPRMQATLARIQQRLSHNSMVARYENTDEDGVGGPEGTFSICTFWMVDSLTLVGRTQESRALFERMLSHAGPLGLFSEEMDPVTGALLGNYPQAFTHMALLNSAHNLELYPRGVPRADATVVHSGP